MFVIKQNYIKKSTFKHLKTQNTFKAYNKLVLLISKKNDEQLTLI